ncbi:hypothetical protein OSB04_001466 [Centaurea solstitialis]|uniref:MULE transposase domain-containing protein n=1 Tax=Centaurea solstitialis TaxID=347529 RepID=A0AA38TR29_9ASTR|nr:hypothetical protein OSB04_001466 [Centaurea solstitialis]
METWGENLHLYRSYEEQNIYTNIKTEGDATDLYIPNNTSKFVTNKVFHSREDLVEWVQQVGRSLGYAIVIKRSVRKASGVMSKVCFQCDRGGVYGSKASSRNTTTKKINCPFGLIGKYVKAYNWWTLRVVCDEHNHDHAQHIPMKGQPRAMRLCENEVRLVEEDLSTQYVKPREILFRNSSDEEHDIHTNIKTEGDATDLYVPENTSKFVTNKVFHSREDLVEWVQQVGRSMGYAIVIKRSVRKASGVMSKVCFMCDRGGVCRSKKISSRNTTTKKINCPFALIGKYVKAYNWWTLRVICDKHNHDHAQHIRMQGHPYAMRLSENEAQLVEDLSTQYLKPREILIALKEKNVDNLSTLKTIYNARQKFRRTKNAGRTEMQVVMSFLKQQGYVYESRANETTNELEDLFFAHPKSLELWRAFPDVVLIDATYKTDRYRLSLLEIVGVTSTGVTFCLAFVFMQKQRECGYVWALNCLKSTIGDICPRVVVTDRELALMNACNIVFPDAKQLLCRWHINQCILKNCRPLILDLQTWNSFYQVWMKLVDSPTKEWYEYNLSGLEAILFYYPGVLDYLNEEWLTRHKEMFVSAWAEYLNFGNHLINQAERQHFKLKLYLESKQSDLQTSLNYIHEVIQSEDALIMASIEVSNPRNNATSGFYMFLTKDWISRKKKRTKWYNCRAAGTSHDSHMIFVTRFGNCRNLLTAMKRVTELLGCDFGKSLKLRKITAVGLCFGQSRGAIASIRSSLAGVFFSIFFWICFQASRCTIHILFYNTPKFLLHDPEEEMEAANTNCRRSGEDEERRWKRLEECMISLATTGLACSMESSRKNGFEQDPP